MHGVAQTVNIDLAVSVHDEGKTYIVSGRGEERRGREGGREGEERKGGRGGEGRERRGREGGE